MWRGLIKGLGNGMGSQSPLLTGLQFANFGETVAKKNLNYFFFAFSRVERVDVITVRARNTKGESITVPLTSCLTGLESAV